MVSKWEGIFVVEQLAEGECGSCSIVGEDDIRVVYARVLMVE